MKTQLKNILLTLSFASALFGSGAPGAFAQTAAAPANGPAKAADVTELDISGLKVLLKKRVASPTVAAGLFIRGGVRNLTAKNAGLEAFALSAATEGSKNFPKAALRKELSRTGSAISSGASYDYSVLALTSTRQHFERSWDFFADVALNPGFASTDVERVREGILTGLRNATSNPEGHVEELENALVYAGHPYANDPSGTIENVARFQAEDLRAYHRELMQTSRLLLVIVGDFDAAIVQKKIADTLGKLPRGSYKEVDLPALAFAKPSVDVTKRELETNYVKGTFAAPRLGEADYYPMRVAITILQSRVFQEVRVKRNLSYAPDADIAALRANTGSIAVSSTDPNQSVKIMLAEIERMKDEPVGADDMMELSSYFLTTHYLKLETNAAQAAELAQYELIGGGWRNASSFLDRITKVAPADIQRVAKMYMKNLRFVVLGNPAVINREVYLKSGE